MGLSRRIKNRIKFSKKYELDIYGFLSNKKSTKEWFLGKLGINFLEGEKLFLRKFLFELFQKESMQYCLQVRFSLFLVFLIKRLLFRILKLMVYSVHKTIKENRIALNFFFVSENFCNGSDIQPLFLKFFILKKFLLKIRLFLRSSLFQGIKQSIFRKFLISVGNKVEDIRSKKKFSQRIPTVLELSKAKKKVFSQNQKNRNFFFSKQKRNKRSFLLFLQDCNMFNLQKKIYKKRPVEFWFMPVKMRYYHFSDCYSFPRFIFLSKEKTVQDNMYTCNRTWESGIYAFTLLNLLKNENFRKAYNSFKQINDSTSRYSFEKLKFLPYLFFEGAMLCDSKLSFKPSKFIGLFGRIFNFVSKKKDIYKKFSKRFIDFYGASKRAQKVLFFTFFIKSRDMRKKSSILQEVTDKSYLIISMLKTLIKFEFIRSDFFKEKKNIYLWTIILKLLTPSTRAILNLISPYKHKVKLNSNEVEKDYLLSFLDRTRIDHLNTKSPRLMEFFLEKLQVKYGFLKNNVPFRLDLHFTKSKARPQKENEKVFLYRLLKVTRRIFGNLTQRRIWKTRKISLTKNFGSAFFNSLLLFESRLDIFIIRIHFCDTLAEARGLIEHGIILVNGRAIYLRDYRVSFSDTVSVKPDKRLDFKIMLMSKMTKILHSIKTSSQKIFPSYLELNFLNFRFSYVPRLFDISKIPTLFETSRLILMNWGRFSY